MSSYSDPDTLLITLGLPLAIVAIYIWEYITHLYYDFRLLKQPRPWNLTTFAYLLCRQLNLCTSICLFLLKSGFQCKVILPLFLSSCFSVASASALLALRIIALWSNTFSVITFALVGILAQVGLAVYNGSQAHLHKLEGGSTFQCLFTQTIVRELAPMICSSSFDTVLCILMFFGLRRQQQRSPALKSRLLHTLRNQGLLWTACGTAGNIPVIVLFIASRYQNATARLLTPFFETFACFIISVSATRMTRALYMSNSERPAQPHTANSQLFTSVDTFGMTDHSMSESTSNIKYVGRSS